MTLGSYRNAAGSQGGSTTPQNPISVPVTGGSGQSGIAVLPTDTSLLAVMAGGGTNASAAPAGWTAVKSDTTINSNGARYAIYRKIIGADTTITPSWPTAPASGNNTAHLAVFFSGVNGIEAVGAHGLPGSASTITTCPSTTTTGIDRVVLAIAMCKGASTGFPGSASWSSGWTECGTQLAGSNFFPSISVAYRNLAAAGASGDATCTWNFATLNQVGIQVALIPAVTPLAGSLSIVPNSGAAPLGVVATVLTAGGNGNPVTFSMDWDDGNTSPGQSSNVFPHTYTAAGEYDPVATFSQA